MKTPTVFKLGMRWHRKLWEEKGYAIFRFETPYSADERGIYIMKDDRTNLTGQCRSYGSFREAYYGMTGKGWAIPPDVLDLLDEL